MAARLRLTRCGSTSHFIGALLGINNGVELRHVPFRSSVPGVTDVVGGQLASMVTPNLAVQHNAS